jgi:iron(III) transport system substrate-binding protein
MPVEIIFPDQGEGGLGALFIPNTLAIIKGGPHPEAARQLVEYLLSPEVEGKLAQSESAQFPLHALSSEKSPAAPADPIRRMEIDFRKAADKWDTAAEFLKQHFATAE